MGFIIYLLCICHLLKLIQGIYGSQIAREYMNQSWNKLSQRWFDPFRNISTNILLKDASGIYAESYINENRKFDPDLKSTLLKSILIQVVERKDDILSENYKSFLKNWLCFARHHHYKPILYLLDRDGNRINQLAAELKYINSDVIIISYPHGMFWHYLSYKSNLIVTGNNRADYRGDYPSVKHFGDIVKYIPILEALELGYDVIYIDSTVTLVQDPIPYILSSDPMVDISFSQKNRNCSYPSYLFNKTISNADVDLTENIIRIRSNKKTVNWLQNLIIHSIDQNILSSTKLLGLNNNDVKESNGCLPILSPKYNHTQINNITEPKKLTYCLLNEFIHQNGQSESSCLKHRGASYMLGIIEAIPPMSHNNRINNNNSLDNNYDIKNNKISFPPITFKMHHVSHIHRTLYDRGLWLLKPHKNNTNNDYNSKACYDYDVRKTSFGKMNILDVLFVSKWTPTLELSSLHENDIIKCDNSKSLFIYTNNSIQLYQTWNGITNPSFSHINSINI
eukprot:gene15870-21517_t